MAGVPTGPDAPLRATAAALERAVSARAVLLVEGVSDQAALEALARRQGRDLAAERVVVLPVGGAQAVARYLARFGPGGTGVVAGGLYDAAEERDIRRALERTGSPAADGLEALGFFRCDRDLEDELLRAAGAALVERVLAAGGDLAAFRTLQGQPAWRGRPFGDQARRFLGAGSQRKTRYARLLVEAVDDDRMPRPLVEVLARTG